MPYNGITPVRQYTGILDISQGATWNDHTSDDLDNAQSQLAVRLSAGLVYTSLLIINLHASQTLYVRLVPSAAGATTHAIPVTAGAVLSMDLEGGVPVTSVAIQGSGAATTGQITAHFRVA